MPTAHHSLDDTLPDIYPVASSSTCDLEPSSSVAPTSLPDLDLDDCFEDRLPATTQPSVYTLPKKRCHSARSPSSSSDEDVQPPMKRRHTMSTTVTQPDTSVL